MERFLGVGLTILALAIGLILLAPRSLRRAFTERGLPLVSVDEQWTPIESEVVTLSDLKKQPVRAGRPVLFRPVGGKLHRLTTPESGVSASEITVCPEGRLLALLPYEPYQNEMGPVEWDGAAWRPAGSPPASDERRPRPQNVLCMDGKIIVVTASVLLNEYGTVVGSRPYGRMTPTADGLFTLNDFPNAFRFWFTRHEDGPWLPIGGGRNIRALTEFKGGVIAWGENIGRVTGAIATWREWPTDFTPTGVQALSSGGYVAWNNATIYIARTFETEPVGMNAPASLTDVIEGLDESGVLWAVAGNVARRFSLR